MTKKEPKAFPENGNLPDESKEVFSARRSPPPASPAPQFVERVRHDSPEHKKLYASPLTGGSANGGPTFLKTTPCRGEGQDQFSRAIAASVRAE